MLIEYRVPNRGWVAMDIQWPGSHGYSMGQVAMDIQRPGKSVCQVAIGSHGYSVAM